jgi:hypothetical protein
VWVTLFVAWLPTTTRSASASSATARIATDG